MPLLKIEPKSFYKTKKSHQFNDFFYQKEHERFSLSDDLVIIIFYYTIFALKSQGK